MRNGFGYFEEDTLAGHGEISLWRRILTYIRPYRLQVLTAIFLSLIISGSSLALPYLVRQAVDNFVINSSLATDKRLAGLGLIGIYFIGIIVCGLLANFLQVVLLEWTGQNIMHAMRQQLYQHMLGLNLAFYNKNPVGKLTTRLTNDIQNMHEMFTSVIITLFNDFIRIFGILIILFILNRPLALIMALVVPIMAVNTIWFSRLARAAFREIRTYLARINSFLQESMTGIAVIQIFERQQSTLTRFIELNQKYLGHTLHQIKIFGLFMPVIELTSAICVALIILYGGSQILVGQMTLGILIAFLSYMRLFFQPLRELSQKYSIVQSAMASAERIFQLLDTANNLPQAANPLQPTSISGRIDFRGVDFAYTAGHSVLRGLNLTVKAGETVAIVGATGAGKSTLINLLERFYDPTAGSICIDANNLKELDRHWLRDNIGLVMQDVLIIPASLRDNILLDRNLSEHELTAIIQAAQLTELVNNLADGWQTLIGEGGAGLSAGEKQLLALARVLARDPRILVLDEATSNVDSQTEILIERAIAKTLANRTSIVIAHRLSTIRRADRIIVMADGEIIEQGKHENLLAEHGLYYRLQNLDQTNLTRQV